MNKKKLIKKKKNNIKYNIKKNLIMYIYIIKYKHLLITIIYNIFISNNIKIKIINNIFFIMNLYNYLQNINIIIYTYT